MNYKLFLGTGQLCRKTFLHEGLNMHEGTLLRENTFARKFTLARRVNFHKSKKKYYKNYYDLRKGLGVIMIIKSKNVIIRKSKNKKKTKNN